MKDLKRLQIINLFGCWKLDHLPSMMGNLKCIEHMNLRYIPRCLSELTSLMSLNLYNCSNLSWEHERPSHEENSRSDEHKLRLFNLCNMRQLRHLDIDCKKELSVPKQLMGTFVEMRTLCLNMRKLEALPGGMKGMENMEKVLRKKNQWPCHTH